MRTILCVSLLLMLSAGLLAPQDPQQAPQQAPQTQPQTEVPVPVGNLSLQGASLEQVVDQLARQLRLNYVVDAPIEGTVTLNTYGDPGNLDARNLLELLLSINGLGMVREGDIYRIVLRDQMRRLPVQRAADASGIPEDDRPMLNLIFLKYMTVATLVPLLQEFTDDRTIIKSYEPANLLLVLDSRRNMRLLMELVAMFDSDTFAGERIRQFDIEHVLPSELMKDLEGILRSLSLDGQTATVRFLPVDRIGLLIAIAPNPGVFATVSDWVRKLDTPVTITSSLIDTYVYRVRYGRSDCLAMALNMLYNPNLMYGGGMGMAGANGAGGLVGGGNPYQGFGGGYGPYGGWAGGGGGGGGGGGFGASPSGYGSGNSFNSNFGGSGGCGPYGGMGSTGGGFGGGGYAPYGGYAAQTPISTQPAPLAGGMIGGGTVAPAQNGTAATGAATGGQTAPSGPNPPRIVANPLDNALLIQGTREQYQAILKLLRDLDVPPRQILLQAKIYSLTLNNSVTTGIQALLRPRTTADRRLTGSLADGLAILEAGTLVGQSRELMAAIAAQEVAGNARVISEPSLIATDSIPASINVGAQVPVLTGQTATPVQVGGTNAFTQGISSHNTGVTLQVNARVNPSGVVTLIINQEISEPAATTTSNIPTPTFNQQVVQTQITLQDGDTIAIGGTISESTSTGTTGIPGLSRIPGLGMLFGSRAYSKDRSELIIFMTPHVIYDTTDLLEASEEVKMRMRRLQRYIN